MTTTTVCHTADLRPGDLDAVRDLLHAVFGDELTEDDVEHCLGGMHVLIHDGDGLLAHGSVVTRRLLHGDRPLRTGYLEGVAVRADRRRQGHGGAVMSRLERIVRGGYDLGALGATDEGVPLYLAHGWRLWTGTASVLAPEGRRRTPDEDGGIYLLTGYDGAAELAWPDGRVEGSDLACDWRGGDVW